MNSAKNEANLKFSDLILELHAGTGQKWRQGGTDEPIPDAFMSSTGKYFHEFCRKVIDFLFIENILIAVQFVGKAKTNRADQAN